MLVKLAHECLRLGRERFVQRQQLEALAEEARVVHGLYYKLMVVDDRCHMSEGLVEVVSAQISEEFHALRLKQDVTTEKLRRIRELHELYSQP